MFLENNKITLVMNPHQMYTLEILDRVEKYPDKYIPFVMNVIMCSVHHLSTEMVDETYK